MLFYDLIFRYFPRAFYFLPGKKLLFNLSCVSSFMDGRLSLIHIFVGSLLYVVLNSGLTMMGFSTQMMQLIQGVVFLIFVAVFADRESLTVIK